MIQRSLPPWVTGDAAARRLWWMAGNPELVGIALTTYHLAVPLLACSAVVQIARLDPPPQQPSGSSLITQSEGGLGLWAAVLALTQLR